MPLDQPVAVAEQLGSDPDEENPYLPGVHVFAPRDDSAGRGRSVVEILDASDVASGPVARVRLPQRVPVGFHATWARADQLQAQP